MTGRHLWPVKKSAAIITKGSLLEHHHHQTTSVLRPFFRDHPGETVLEENFWTLWCKGRLTEADTPTIRLGATPAGLISAHLHHSPIFYRPNVLPAAQPTVSKHWRQLRIRIRERTLEFSSTVLPAPSPYHKFSSRTRRGNRPKGSQLTHVLHENGLEMDKCVLLCQLKSTNRTH